MSAIVAGVTAVIKSLDIFKTKLSETQKQQAAFNNVAIKAIDGYVEQKVQMEILTDRVNKGGKSFQEKQSILKTYNKQFGDTIGKAKDYAQAEQLIITKGKDFIAALMLRAKAMAALQLAVEQAKVQIEMQVNPEKALDWMDKTSLTVNRWIAAHTKVGSQAWQDAMDGVRAYKELAAKESSEIVKNAEASQKKYAQINNDLTSQSDALAAKVGYRFND